ncbi:hypothetical protein M9H77_12179 [Catharanthus roseus]|uniref:Uncharacterized protein n=1 Tax=Catharanthus roseus TaxID=4058 RepID=A0ACC0BGP8_CATRO|nr:hypothetical protein M9H77_12179 [Catharanthus roseus]
MAVRHRCSVEAMASTSKNVKKVKDLCFSLILEERDLCGSNRHRSGGKEWHRHVVNFIQKTVSLALRLSRVSREKREIGKEVVPVTLVTAEAISEGVTFDQPLAYPRRLDAALPLLGDRSIARFYPQQLVSEPRFGSSMPASVNNLPDLRDDLSLSDVKNALKSKELDLQKENKSHGENFFVRGRIDRREPPSHRFKSRSKSREKSKVKHFYCGKEDRMKNKYFKRIKDEKQRKHGK